jgi:hypothetical protein
MFNIVDSVDPDIPVTLRSIRYMFTVQDSFALVNECVVFMELRTFDILGVLPLGITIASVNVNSVQMISRDLVTKLADGNTTDRMKATLVNKALELLLTVDKLFELLPSWCI